MPVLRDGQIVGLPTSAHVDEFIAVSTALSRAPADGDASANATHPGVSESAPAEGLARFTTGGTSAPS